MMNDKENQEDPLAGLCKTASPVKSTKLNMSVEVVVCSDKHPFNYFLKHMSLWTLRFFVNWAFKNYVNMSGGRGVWVGGQINAD